AFRPHPPHRSSIRQHPDIKPNQPLHSRPLSIPPSVPHGTRIPIPPPDGPFEPTGNRGIHTSTRPRARLNKQPLPSVDVVSCPPQEPKVFPIKPRRPIGSNQRRLNHKGPRPTHRIKEFRRGRPRPRPSARAPLGANARAGASTHARARSHRKILPPRPQQNPRRDVLLQRRLSGGPPVTPAVQTLASQIQRHHKAIPMSMRMNSHTRPLELHTRPPRA
ncbi:MAG: hypothetical protein JWL65_4286, partial [Gammaproteobacteria bacterium]|nr:hypothetical protein [Gammaproteobacteria bacterium]